MSGRLLFNPNCDIDRAVHPERNWLEDEFIAFTIVNASFGKLGCLTNPYQIPHKQHWIMLSSLYKENLPTPKVKDDLE